MDEKIDDLLQDFLISHDAFKFKAQKARYNAGDKEHMAAKRKLMALIATDKREAVEAELSDLKNHTKNPGFRDDQYYFDVGYRAMQRLAELKSKDSTHD